MKIIIRSLLIGLGIFTVNLVHAQDTDLTATNIDWSAAPDWQVALQAIEQVPPMPAIDATNGTTFWSAEHSPASAEPWPPLPGNFAARPLWDLGDGTYLLDDMGYDYGAAKRHKTQSASLSASGGTMVMSADDVPAPPGDGDGSTNDYGSAGLLEGLAPDYGTNLYIAQVSRSAGMYSGIISNTAYGVQYELQYKYDLESTNGWQSATPNWFVFGSDVTNWTTFSVPMTSSSNMFFRVRSWGSVDDGSDLPLWWEQEYFGTNLVNANAQDSAGDGWTIYQKYEMGIAPGTFTTPPTPQGTVSSYDPSTGLVTVDWLASPGPVTGYTVNLDGNTQYVSAASTSFQNNISEDDASFDPEDFGPTALGSIKVVANYMGGNSSAASVSLQTVPANPVYYLGYITSGQNGQGYLTVPAFPPGTVAVQITRIDQYAETFYGDSSFDTNFDIPVSAFTNGVAALPAPWSGVCPVDGYGVCQYRWWIQTVDALGNASGGSYIGFGYNDDSDVLYSAYSDPTYECPSAPWFDGREQLKQNLTFALRAATVDYPLGFSVIIEGDYPPFSEPTNYAVADYYQWFYNYGEEQNFAGDVFWPFEENYMLLNFAFGSTNVNGAGLLTTGVGWGEYGVSTILSEPSLHLFQPPVSSGTVIAPVLGTNQTQSLGFYNETLPLGEIGLTDSSGTYSMASDARNIYGLPFVAATIAYDNDGDLDTTTLSAGNQTTQTGFFYPVTAQPQLQTVEYDFWNPNAGYWDSGSWIALQPLPGMSGFSPTNQSQLQIAGVGQPCLVAGYAKETLSNGYSGVYGYLGQYFTNAYEINTNGSVMTNQTGIVSPYGDFFATQPGPAALVTMPDPDTGAQGTCTVYCVSLALDANHDGTMDLNFGGTDATSPIKPYFFWANNNYDRWAWDADDETNYMDDVAPGDAASMCPYTPNTPTPDCNYRDMYGNRVIPDTRDLEDYARLWVCGATSNLLAALPAGSTVTLNWGDVGSPNSANPTIDIFQATDPDGGVEYLTNETSATTQIDPAYSSYVGRLGPGGSIQLNSSYWSGWAGSHLIWCGVSNGTGGLNLTIADTNGNVLAQTTAYIQIEDIKQMYERWTVGDEPPVAPLANAEAASEDLPPFTMPFQYTPPQDTNTPYILFAHGWNMNRFDKDRFAETAFKRLYWQGYQGRFGSFRWPTSWGFTGDFSQLVTDPQEKDNYDNSENFAWLSAVGLLNKLEDLNTEYSGHVYLLAHSMGNVVAGEALTLAGNNQVVNTYVASQAAVPAHVYDYTIPNYSFEVFIGGIGFNMGPNTPNIYGDWFAGDNGGGAGRIISLYNTNDYALSRLHWQLDQLVKPDILVAENGALWNYGYNGSTNDPPPWNNFFKTNDFTGTRVNFDIVNTPTNRYEVMAYAAQAYTTALGATPDVGNLTKSLNLITLWPSPDPLDNDYASHFYHSAEFRGDSVWEWNYWNTLLFSSQTGFNIANP